MHLSLSDPILRIIDVDAKVPAKAAGGKSRALPLGIFCALVFVVGSVLSPMAAQAIESSYWDGRSSNNAWHSSYNATMVGGRVYGSGLVQIRTVLSGGVVFATGSGNNTAFLDHGPKYGWSSCRYSTNMATDFLQCWRKYV
jgi:hypothetical protein